MSEEPLEYNIDIGEVWKKKYNEVISEFIMDLRGIYLYIRKDEIYDKIPILLKKWEDKLK